MKTKNFFQFSKALLFASLTIFVIACDEDKEAPVESMMYTLNPVGGSGVSGSATFEKISGTSTRITIDLSGTSSGNTHPMHIHNNSVSEGGGIAISLTAVNGANGMSVTDVSQMDNGTAITYEQLLDFDGYINVHLSSAAMGTIIAQGDVGQNAP